jgi:hypothetical protein
MKLVGVLSTAVLSLALGAAVPAFTQDREDEKARPAQDEKKAEPERSAKQEPKSAQEEKNARPEEKAAPQKQQQRATANRIPADRYKANFGSGHTFRVSQGDYNNRRFQYGGYSFGFVGMWPSNWLYTQNVYVVEINGVYYLCNPAYPGVNLELSFTL